VTDQLRRLQNSPEFQNIGERQLTQSPDLNSERLDSGFLDDLIGSDQPAFDPGFNDLLSNEFKRLRKQKQVDSAVETTLRNEAVTNIIGDAEREEKKAQLEDQFLENQLNEILLNDELDPSQKLEAARDLGRELDNEDVVRFVAEAQEDLERFSQPLDDSEVPTIRERMSSIRERRLANGKLAKQVREEVLKDLPQGWTMDQFIKFAASAGSPFQAGQNITPDQAEQLLVPDFYFRVAEIASEVLGDGSVVDTAIRSGKTLTIADQIQAVRESILSAEPEQAQEFLDKIVNEVDSAGILTEGNQQKRDLLLTMLDGIDLNDPVSGLENLFATIEIGGLAASAFGPILRGVRSISTRVRAGLRAARRVDDSPEITAQDISDVLPSSKSKEKNNAPAPEIPAGSVADETGQTKGGAERLVAAATRPNADNATEALGTTVDEVFGSLVVPKSQNAAALPGKHPVVESAFIPDSQKSKILDQREKELVEMVGSRPHDSKVWIQDGRIHSQTVIGNAKGGGFAQKSSAQRVINKSDELRESGAVPVKGENGQWFIALDDQKPIGLRDLESVKLEGVTVGGRWRRFLGKSQAFTAEFIRGGNVAFRNGLETERLLKRTLQPFFRLNGDQKANVWSIMEEFENMVDPNTGRVGVQPSAADLEARLGRGKQLQAALSLQEGVRKAWHIENKGVRDQLEGLGYGITKLDNNSELILRPRSNPIPEDAKVLDLTKNRISVGKSNPERFALFELAEPTTEGARFARAPLGKEPIIDDLPAHVIRWRPGYLGPRIYKSPVFIDEVLQDGTRVTRHTAPTARHANDWIDRQRAVNPDVTFQPRRADEIQPDVGSSLPAFSEQYRLNNQLRTSHRKDEIIKDIDTGEVQVVPPSERLQRMISRTANTAGIRKWTSAVEVMWDNTYSDLFDSKFSLGRTPRVKEGVDPIDRRVQEALEIHAHARMMNGLAPAQTGVEVNSFLLSVSDGIIGLSEGIPFVRRVGRAVANQISGLDNNIIRGAKGLAFNAFMALNPVRMAIMQRTMIPLYFGVEGGPAYFLGGRYFRDMMVLTGDGLQSGEVTQKARRNIAMTTARSLGMTRKDAISLIEDFENSSLLQVLDNHIFALGDVKDVQRRARSVNAVREGGSKFTTLMKSIGFDSAIASEIRTSWLLSRERFIKQKGRKPKTRDDFNEIDDVAFNLTLNQNPSDTLVTQHGTVSLFTQFLSHQIKMSGRLLSTAERLVTRGRSGGDQVFTTGELVRMSAINLAIYGLEGWGVVTLANKLVDQTIPDSDDPEIAAAKDQAKLLVAQGIGGFMANAVINMGLNPEEAVQMSFSGEFGPANFFGSNVDTMANVVKSFATLSTAPLTQGLNFNFDSPALSLIGGVGEAVKMGLMLNGGLVNLSPPEQALLTVERVARKFPLTNSLIQSIAINNLGFTIDSAGRPEVEANKRAAIAALAGIDPSDKAAMRQVLDDRFGEFDGTTEEDKFTAIENQARDDARNIVTPLLRAQAGFGPISWEQTETFLTEQQEHWHTILDPDQYQTYYNTMVSELDALGTTRIESIRDMLIRRVEEGNIGIGVDHIEELRNLPFDPQTSEKLIEDVKSTTDARNEFREVFQDLITGDPE